MPRTVTDMIKAGALSALCRYHHSIGGEDDQWERVREFAYREFREIDSAAIEQLLSKAKAARCAARLFRTMPKHATLRPIDLPTLD